MLEFLRRLGEGIRDAWQRLSMNARVQLGLAAFLTMSLLLFVVIRGSSQPYVDLYPALDPKEAQEVVAWLESNGYSGKYEVRNEGATLRVQARDRQTIRLALAGQGMPKAFGGAPGFEIFDTQNLMSNEWQQNVQLRRAVVGEAQRILKEFDFVRSAHVVITEAQERLFADEQQPAKAAVTLDTSRKLAASELAAVVQIISASGGANLGPDNITVIVNGKVAKEPIGDSVASAANDKLGLKLEYENTYQQKIEDALGKVGRRVVVNVNAELDWSSETTEARTVTEGVPISTLENTTTSETREAPAEGAPGPNANVPTEAAAGEGGVVTSQEVTETIENLDVGESKTTTRTEPGTLKRITAAIFVDGTYDKPVLGADGTPTGEIEYQDPTPEFLESISEFALKTLGAGAQATDITVAALRFDTTPPPSAVIPSGMVWYESQWLQALGQLFAMMTMFFLVRYFMRNALAMPKAQEEEYVEEAKADPEIERRRVVADEVERLSREDPASVAALLRTWMTEE